VAGEGEPEGTTYLQRERMAEIHVVSLVCVICILSTREAILAPIPLFMNALARYAPRVEKSELTKEPTRTRQ
jgi:hypothetical protein